MAGVTFLSEDFNAADGTLLENIGTGLVRSTVSGSNGAMQVTGGRAVMSSATNSVYCWGNNPAPVPNYEVSGKHLFVTAAGNPSVGVCGRMEGPGGAALTFYQARFVNNTSGLVLARFLNGGTITLLSTPLNYLAGADPKLTLRMEGDKLSVLVDDVLMLGPHTDNTIPGPGYVGLRTASANVNQIRVDEVRATTIENAQAVQGSIAYNEGNEVQSVAGNISVSLFGQWTEGSEANSLTARLDILASASWVESDESQSASIIVGGGISAAIGWNEGSEVLSLAAQVSVRAFSEWTEESGTTSIAVLVAGVPSEDIDALLVPPRQTVVFEGSSRVVAFEGGKRVVSFEGSKRLVEFQ